MKHGIYPGTFDPWHEGHSDVLQKALKVFDFVTVLRCTNPDKNNTAIQDRATVLLKKQLNCYNNVKVCRWQGLLVNYPRPYDAFIRGLRNGSDLEYEKIQQYWNEDLGMTVPIVFFLADRKLVHISSSAIRALATFTAKVK